MVFNELGGRRPTGLFGQPSLKPTAYKDALTPEPKGLRELLGHEFGGRIDADTYTTAGLGEADGRRLIGYWITGFGHGSSPRLLRAHGRVLAESEVLFGVHHWGCRNEKPGGARRPGSQSSTLRKVTISLWDRRQ